MHSFFIDMGLANFLPGLASNHYLSPSPISPFGVAAGIIEK
jgi:hypothetical protein